MAARARSATRRSTPTCAKERKEKKIILFWLKSHSSSPQVSLQLASLASFVRLSQCVKEPTTVALSHSLGIPQVSTCSGSSRPSPTALTLQVRTCSGLSESQLRLPVSTCFGLSRPSLTTSTLQVRTCSGLSKCLLLQPSPTASSHFRSERAPDYRSASTGLCTGFVSPKSQRIWSVLLELTVGWSARSQDGTFSYLEPKTHTLPGSADP